MLGKRERERERDRGSAWGQQTVGFHGGGLRKGEEGDVVRGSGVQAEAARAAGDDGHLALEGEERREVVELCLCHCVCVCGCVYARARMYVCAYVREPMCHELCAVPRLPEREEKQASKQSSKQDQQRAASRLVELEGARTIGSTQGGGGRTTTGVPVLFSMHYVRR